jgi:hypothetical protein
MIVSSENPTYGEQEGRAYNGHFGCTCYHALFVFNQLGDGERCALRPGNIHSANVWRAVLEPVVARYQSIVKAANSRGDAPFANLRDTSSLSRGDRLHGSAAGKYNLPKQDRTPAQTSGRASAARGAPLLRELRYQAQK